MNRNKILAIFYFVFGIALILSSGILYMKNDFWIILLGTGMFFVGFALGKQEMVCGGDG